MSNRFGLKDFLFLTALTLLGALVVLGMIQDDRSWRDMQRLRREVERLGQQVGALSRSVQGGASSGFPAAPDTEASWAKPGIPITHPAPYTLPHDPATIAGFRRGGTITEALEGQPHCITPYRYTDTYGRRIAEIVCEFLADYSPESLELQGLLAEAWQEDPAGLWLRVRIRPEARFSDGRPVTAEDVRFTIKDYVQNPAIEAERFRQACSLISGVEVISERAVEFRFAERRFNNRDLALRLPILPAHIYRAYSPDQINSSSGLLVGSGPYRLAGADPERQWAPPGPVELVANEQYWRGAPPLDRLRFTVAADPVARLAAFENDQADLMRATGEQFVAKRADRAFSSAHTLLAWSNIRSGYSVIAWNCGKRGERESIFSDARVRRAMTMLLDRDKIIAEVYHGLAAVATSPFNPLGPQGDPKLIPWPYDLEQARSLLAQAGWEDRDGDGALDDGAGHRFDFIFNYTKGSDTGRKIGAYLQDQCAKVGVRCEPVMVEWSVQQAAMKSRDFDSMMMQWSQNDPENDPYQLWHSSGISPPGDNFVQWSSRDADRLMESARTELDPSARIALWRSLQAVIHEQQPCTFVARPQWLRFVGPRLKNAHPYLTGLEPREWYSAAPGP